MRRARARDFKREGKVRPAGDRQVRPERVGGRPEKGEGDRCSGRVRFNI